MLSVNFYGCTIYTCCNSGSLSPAYFSICLVTLFRLVVSALKIVFASCGMEPIKSLEPLLNFLNIYGYANLVLQRSLLVYCVAAYVHEDGSISSKTYMTTVCRYAVRFCFTGEVQRHIKPLVLVPL